ncbi:D-alanyl-D-alanine carboxypeptidase DacA [Paenibacillus solanacearum]|uniref:D-alanyl-D-alanine carboxypeptidase DacA n=1 Tax=Paenibacillus solanacearum TaxID=2048548 RepID=A0A916NS65_9BACL|nr:D-alanyl-D-alanine carboxypeptidase family protein [Paenibacillus solanacearum]CAG7652398.1 D-alanyl-D-alanine carboxypeptidase DacA [Paenibacillus solanacearum]
MKRFWKWGKLALGITLAAQIAIFSIYTGTVKAAEAEAPNLGITAKAAILMEAATGQVLYAQNEDVPMPPASMAKMMTEYLVFESIVNKKISWTDTVQISEYSAFLSNNKALSGIPKAMGDTYSVEDLFYAVTIYSDNGAAVALAEKISGTEEKFVQLMNETAVRLGLSKDAYFIGTSGLDRVDLGKYAPSSLPGETIFTARDAALIAYHLLKDYPDIVKYSSIVSKKFRPTDANPMINYDWMLEGNKDNINFKKYVYQGLDGLKTGHTDKAGYCFTGTAVRNDTRLISVVMNSSTRDNSFYDTKKILDYGFSNFEKKEVVQAGATVDALPAVPIKKGVNTQAAAVTGEGLSLLVKKGTPDSAFVKTAQAKPDLVAPVKKGDEVGTLTVTYDNKPYTVKMVAANDEEKGSWFRLFFRAIKNFFVDMISGSK